MAGDDDIYCHLMVDAAMNNDNIVYLQTAASKAETISVV